MKTLSVFVFMMMALLSIGQANTNLQQNKIHGTWQATSDGDQMTLILNADGTGKFDDEEIKYTAKDNKFTLTIVAESETIIYNYDLQENSLTISGGDLDAAVTFSRSKTGSK